MRSWRDGLEEVGVAGVGFQAQSRRSGKSGEITSAGAAFSAFRRKVCLETPSRGEEGILLLLFIAVCEGLTRLWKGSFIKVS